jgi:hypothetical protein
MFLNHEWQFLARPRLSPISTRLRSEMKVAQRASCCSTNADALEVVLIRVAIGEPGVVDLHGTRRVIGWNAPCCSGHR